MHNKALFHVPKSTILKEFLQSGIELLLHLKINANAVIDKIPMHISDTEMACTIFEKLTLAYIITETIGPNPIEIISRKRKSL